MAILGHFEIFKIKHTDDKTVVKIRIISGKYKGRKLKIPDDLTIRPTQDRVKESIFNVISNLIEGSVVLDLFSGSGSLGIEALSRGAKKIYFIDQEANAIKLIRENIENLNYVEVEYYIIQKDVVRFLQEVKDISFDLVFLDPPYKIEQETMRKAFELLGDRQTKILDKDSLMIYEYFFKKDITYEINDLNIIKKSHFGDKIVSYIKI